MEFFTKYKKLVSSFFLIILLSVPIYTISAQKSSTAEDSTHTEIQKKSIKERKATELNPAEETTSDVSSYTFVFYLIYKFISSFSNRDNQ
jgi:hypothetical protein